MDEQEKRLHQLEQMIQKVEEEKAQALARDPSLYPGSQDKKINDQIKAACDRQLAQFRGEVNEIRQAQIRQAELQAEAQEMELRRLTAEAQKQAEEAERKRQQAEEDERRAQEAKENAERAAREAQEAAERKAAEKVAAKQRAEASAKEVARRAKEAEKERQRTLGVELTAEDAGKSAHTFLLKCGDFGHVQIKFIPSGEKKEGK